MNPETSARHLTLAGLGDEELLSDSSLSEPEVEDLLGHQFDLDEQEDWRALDL
jgi:hypothetical protein